MHHISWNMIIYATTSFVKKLVRARMQHPPRLILHFFLLFCSLSYWLNDDFRSAFPSYPTRFQICNLVCFMSGYFASNACRPIQFKLLQLGMKHDWCWILSIRMCHCWSYLFRPPCQNVFIWLTRTLTDNCSSWLSDMSCFVCLTWPDFYEWIFCVFCRFTILLDCLQRESPLPSHEPKLGTLGIMHH